MNDTLGLNLGTMAEIIKEEYYSSPIKIIMTNNHFKYIPVSFERKLIKYDITMSHDIYSDGSLGRFWFVIKMDNSKNIIRNRFEILDIREKNNG